MPTIGLQKRQNKRTMMNRFFNILSRKATVIFIFVLFCVTHTVVAQIDNNGCVGANFGIDAGLYSGTIEYGDGSPSTGTLDWFQGASGFGVIDEGQTAALTALLMAGGNPIYEARMNTSFSSIVNGQIRMEAMYARDYFGGSGYSDNTSFETASKNGQDPASWDIGQAQVLGKNDLIDVAGFMFRDGDNLISGIPSDLWFVGLINRADPGGSAYMDFEFFVQDLQFTPNPVAGDPGEGNFSSGGPQMGHTAYQFDQTTGEITSVGDFIFNTSLEGGVTPNVQLRLWVSYADYTNITPASGFTWGPDFDGAFNGSPYGYASIIPAVNDICGIINLENQNPVAPPWGSLGTKSNTYITNYAEYSILEVGVNMTAIGIDHASLSGANPCAFPLNTFIVKSRASGAFSSGLKDFAGPYGWKPQTNEAMVISSNPLISCDNTQVQLSVDPLRTDIQYTWTTVDGSIVSDPNLSTITVDEPGTYVLHSFLPTGCPMPDAEVVVSLDPAKPFLNAPTATTTVACNGIDGTIDITTSGGSPPYSFEWYEAGNAAVISTVEDPIGLAPGDYYVIVTDAIPCSITSSNFTVGTRVPTTITEAVTHVDCFGNNTGAIDITATGQSPFSYSWSNGSSLEDIAGLSGGDYTVITTDADGCTEQATFTVNEPAILSLSVIKTDETDPAIDDGTINLTVTGGTSGYTYDWDFNGAEDPDIDPEDLTGLAAGTYTVIVTDSNGCTAVISTTILEPEICFDGIDNDGDGLTDCLDPDCTVNPPGSITASENPVCVGDTGVTYTIVDIGADSYTWTVPDGATITAGQGTVQITVTWVSNIGGQICVIAITDGCESTPTCFTVQLNDVPPAAGTINISN